MKVVIERNDKYIKTEQESQKYVDAILKSSSPKKVVVAGPGTGKTYLFKQVLEGKKNTLTLTFVNSLVEDLSLDLYGLSNVRTLHSYARSVLGKINSGVEVFPKLANVIREDAKNILRKDINFDYMFHNRVNDQTLLDFYEARRSYYGKYYGYTDIIHSLVKYFEQNIQNVPTYDYVLVDEFQDFNPLEIALIDLLSQKNPILLAGDDDQALYEDLKSANKRYIRDRYSDKYPDYEPFTLPFCRRSTRVIVDSVNDIINEAKSRALLKDRVDKKYLYFDQEEKDKDSASNPYVVYTQKFATQIPWFISTQIDEIAKRIKDKFSVLIISPSAKKSEITVGILRSKGFQNISLIQKKSGDEIPTLMEGLDILLENEEDSLGWRIIARHLMSNENFQSLLTATTVSSAKPIVEIVEKSFKTNINAILKSLKSLKSGKKLNDMEMDKLLKLFKIDPAEKIKAFLLSQLPAKSEVVINPGIRKIPIKATTIQSSKGLSVDFVFITYFDDQYFTDIKNKKITDTNVYNLLVSLTRAKKGVYLISSNTKKKPTFLSWINNERIKYV
ncbi:MAG: AAA family ATPase [bacterium]